MQHDDHIEMRFLTQFYGLLGVIVAVALFVVLAVAHLTSLAVIVVPLIGAMVALWYAMAEAS